MAPTAPGDATPGFTPPPSPTAPAACQTALRPWQDARPPNGHLGATFSWLFVPLLHAGAGSLTGAAQQAWQSRPRIGDRFAALAEALRNAPAVVPSDLARLINAELECDEHTLTSRAVADAAMTVAALATLPPPLSLAQAMELNMDSEGYLSAAAQAALLQAYGGLAVATAAQTLAEDMQHAPACAASRPRRSRRARRGRARAHNRERVQDVPSCRSASADGDPGVPVCPTPAAAAQADAWLSLDNVDLQEELRHPVPTLQDVPPFLRAAVRGALVQALERLRAERSEGAATGTGSSRAWKLFILVPRMLLARTALRGPQGRAELLGRATAFQRGEWLQLLQSARRVYDPARDAPGNEATWAALTDPTRRPPVPRTEVPPELLSHQPAQPVHLSARAVASALRSARRGGAPGLSGMRAEHLKLLLQDVTAIELLAEAATQLAQARVPADIPPALAMARLTALRKPDGGVRGIATGDVFAALCPKRSPDNGPLRLTWPRDHTSSPCRHEPAPTRWQPTCVPPWRHAAMRCWCRWMAAARTTRCPGQHFWPSSEMSRRSCCRSCACSTAAHPPTHGGIPRAGGGTFCRGKGANRGMPSHQRCLPLASMMRCARQQPGCAPRTASWRSWTTFTSSPAPQAHGQHWMRSRVPSRPTAG